MTLVFPGISFSFTSASASLTFKCFNLILFQNSCIFFVVFACKIARACPGVISPILRLFLISVGNCNNLKEFETEALLFPSDLAIFS